MLFLGQNYAYKGLAPLLAAGRQKVLARYTWPRLAELTEAVYARVLAGGLA